MQRVLPTRACLVCHEGLDGKSESDDYQANLEYWQNNRPPGEADSVEWDKQRPVIMHTVKNVEKTGEPGKIHWICHGCLYKENPETLQYYISHCPLCKDVHVHRGNEEIHVEPRAVAAELHPHYQHPHQQSDENIAVRWYRQEGLFELEESRLQKQRENDAERLVEIEARQQRERAMMDRRDQERRDNERVLAEQQRSMHREKQRKHAHAENEQRLQHLREERHIASLKLGERQRREMERARQERINAAALLPSQQKKTEFLHWINH